MKSYYKLHRDIFAYDLVPHDLAVYLYLCCCQNKDTHTCWPSYKTIAKNVNASQSTVVRAVKNLMERSLIKVTHRKQGKRQTSNLYTILELPPVPSDSNRDFATKTMSLGSPRSEGIVTKQQEINQENTMNFFRNNNQSFNYDEQSKYNKILILAELWNIKDRYNREMMESIIAQMFYANSVCVNGAALPQDTVRKQLGRISYDAVEFMLKNVRQNTSEVTRGNKYLMACLYNAIDEFNLQIELDIARDFGGAL